MKTCFKIVLYTFAVCVVLAFIGVEPLQSYKETVVNKCNSYWAEYRTVIEDRSTEQAPGGQDRTPESITVVPVPLPIPFSYTADLKNPTWGQLLDFLKADTTDEIPYVYPTFVCDNFASALQSNAKVAGWRCAKVVLGMTGYTDPYGLGIAPNAGHACNAFETTDRGLVYIDCTGEIISPEREEMRKELRALLSEAEWRQVIANNDKIVDVQVGAEYNPEFIFPSYGSYLPEGQMGTVTRISIRW